MANKRTSNPSAKTIKIRSFRKKNPDYDAQWRAKNREKLRRQSREFYQRHKEEQRLRSIEKYRKEKIKKPEIIKARNARSDKKKLSTIQGKLHQYVGNVMRHYLRKKSKNGRPWERLVGYTVKQLMKHLEKQFLPGMTWDNYGKWHIDHIIPASVFNFQTPEDIDFKKCWALKNLQPLWGDDNLRKNNKLSKPFQPSLALSDLSEVNYR